MLASLVGAAAAAPATGAGIAWEPRIELDRGGGHKGPWQMNESRYDYVDDPTVAIDARGTVAVAWVDQAQKDVLFQLIGPDGERRLEQPVNVSRSPDVFSWLPRVVFAGDGTLAVLWQEILFSGGSHGGDILFARSTDGGRSFSKPLNLSRSMSGDGKGRLDREHWDNGSLDLAAGPLAHLHAAWTDYEGSLWFSRSVDGGASFSPPLQIWRGAAARPARAPALAVGRQGTVHLGWALGEDPSAAIHVARSDDGGRSFTAPYPAVGGSGRADAPKLAVDGEGTLHLVFAEHGDDGRSRIRYTRAPAVAPRFEAPRDVASPAAALGEGTFPQLAVDGAGHLCVLWEHAPGGAERAVALGLSRSVDGGRSFSAPEAVWGISSPELGFNGSQQGQLMRKLAVSPQGELVLVNSTHRPGETSQVWLVRGRAARPAPSP